MPCTPDTGSTPAPATWPEPDPAAARAILAGLVCLPAYPELAEPAFRRMLEVVRHAHTKERPDWSARA